MAEKVSCAITLDVDMADYVSHAREKVDEMEVCFPLIKSVLEKYPQVKTTWYVRIDRQIEALYGAADYIFIQHADKLDWLRQSGHMIGWHHHAYKLENGSWVQETDDEKVVNDIHRYSAIAKLYNLSSVRMGWGFQTNRTMAALEEEGFTSDSSCIPKPQYKWEHTVKDWTISPAYIYYPSVEDYRKEGTPERNIIEVPFSTVELPVPGDTELVKRYINPSYKPDYFKKAVKDFGTDKNLVLIMHPYEIYNAGSTHKLLSFDIEAFEENINFLIAEGYYFVNIDEFVNEHIKTRSINRA